MKTFALLATLAFTSLVVVRATVKCPKMGGAMVESPKNADTLLRSQIVSTLQTQGIFQGYELPLEKAFAASTWDDFVAVMDPLQVRML